MDTNQLLGSAVIGGAAGALLSSAITGIFNLRAKRTEYVNDYYKTVIQRRVAAYEQLEELIREFKMAVVDKDNRPYHLIFSGENAKISALTEIHAVMSRGLWLSDDAFQQTRKLNYLLFKMPEVVSDTIAFGKANHQQIATIREALEKTLAADMLTLHDVGRFLIRKTKLTRDFEAVELYPRE